MTTKSHKQTITAAKHTAKKEGHVCHHDHACKCGDKACSCDSKEHCSFHENGGYAYNADRNQALAICAFICVIVACFAAFAINMWNPSHEEQTLSSPQQTAELKKWIMDNPEVILASVEQHYQKQRAKAPRPTSMNADPEMIKRIVSDKTNNVLGNPKGEFVIIEFFDYNCSWCQKTNKALAEAIKDAPNIRWILIDTPIFGKPSELISRYAIAAGKQGKFAEYQHALHSAQKRDEAELIQIGETLKLDTKKLTEDAHSEETNQKLLDNQKYARELNITGVPMLIVDGKINPGALLGDKLAEAVKASKAKK